MRAELRVTAIEIVTNEKNERIYAAHVAPLILSHDEAALILKLERPIVEVINAPPGASKSGGGDQ